MLFRSTKCDHVLFGNYKQTAAGTDSTLIEWVKLGTAGTAASGSVASGTSVQTLISLQGLDAVQWNANNSDGNDWSGTCNIRSWCDSFYSSAFNATQQAAIAQTSLTTKSYDEASSVTTTDKVFLLSYDEVKTMTDRICIPTAFALTTNTNSKNACYQDSSTKGCDWWLRSPGNYSGRAASVYTGGDVIANGHRASNTDGAARPVLNLLT